MVATSKLAMKYAGFALIATVANIGVQELVIYAYSGDFSILTSIIAGTGGGLIVKYLLDKHYIFQFQTKNFAHDTQTFMLYAGMGLVTTVVFWCFELGFNYFFETKEMRYLGGVIGLSIGYLAKYRLDKRFVFRLA